MSMINTIMLILIEPFKKMEFTWEFWQMLNAGMQMQMQNLDNLVNGIWNFEKYVIFSTAYLKC